MHLQVVGLRSEGNLLMKLITVNHYLVCMTLMTLRRSLGQRSRSASDGHKNIVIDSTAEPLKGFESKLKTNSGVAMGFGWTAPVDTLQG